MDGREIVVGINRRHIFTVPIKKRYQFTKFQRKIKLYVRPEEKRARSQHGRIQEAEEVGGSYVNDADTGIPAGSHN